jgi:hypothetical protein
MVESARNLYEEMYEELVQLRRGQGLYAPDLHARIGPRLRAVCGIEQRTSAGEARQRLVTRIVAGLATLAPDLRLAVQSAYGLPPASQSRFLRERMEWLGRELARDARTAVRRVEAGLRLLAESLATNAPATPPDAANPYAPEGWYVESLRSTLLLHVTPVQLLEVRRVTATQGGLRRIAVSWSVPVPPEPLGDALRVELLYGGELVRDESLSAPAYWSGWINLPRPLGVGERHEYQVQVTAPGRHLRPYYVHSPLRRCDEFELRAKFDPLVPPQRVWQVDGVPSLLVDEERPVGDELETDPAGEVVSRFRNLRQGLNYGLVWQDGRPSG